MAKQIDFSRYEHFVDAVTSDASKDFLSLSDRLVELDQKGANIERLMTASVGMSAEAGEFTDCLLYTSPSPRDVEESRMPSSA